MDETEDGMTPQEARDCIGKAWGYESIAVSLGGRIVGYETAVKIVRELSGKRYAEGRDEHATLLRDLADHLAKHGFLASMRREAEEARAKIFELEEIAYAEESADA